MSAEARRNSANAGSTVGATRTRDDNGRFQSTDASNTSEARSRAQKELSRRRLELGEEYFSGLVNILFLNGDEDDWIPGDANKGPIHTIAKQVFKTCFLSSQTVRSKTLRDVYFSFVRNKQQHHLPWKVILHGKTKKKYQKRVFKRRRLPKLNSRREMQRVRNWISDALSAKILKLNSFEEVFEVFRTELIQYRLVDGVWTYENYPSASRALQEATTDSVRNSETLAGVDGGEASEQPSRLQSNTNRLLISSLVNSDPIVSPGSSPRTERDIAFQIERIFNAATNSRLFLLLCKTEDDTVDCMVYCSAPVILKNYKDGIIKLDPFLRDALEYCYELHFGVKNIPEHRTRKQRIEQIVELLKLARRCLGLPPYEQLMYRHYLQPAHENNSAVRNFSTSGGTGNRAHGRVSRKGVG